MAIYFVPTIRWAMLKEIRFRRATAEPTIGYKYFNYRAIL